jgi:hypothetical protein
MKRGLLAIMALLAACPAHPAATVIDTDVDYSDFGFGTESGSFPITIASADNRLVACMMTLPGNLADATPTCSVDGTAGTEAWNVNGPGQMRTVMFYVVAPTAGTVNVAWTYTGGLAQPQVGAVSFNGVDQSTPLGSVATGSTSGGTSISLTATADAGDLVLEQMQTGNGPSAGPVVTGGQTELSSYRITVVGDTIGTISYKAGEASTALGWSWTSNANAVERAVAIKAAATSGGSADSKDEGMLNKSSLGGWSLQ